MATDRQLHEEIDQLIAEEHRLRSSGGLSPEDRARLTHLEEHLDQVWDLLRRRDAARDAGRDPDTAQPASVDQVENYLQ